MQVTEALSNSGRLLYYEIRTDKGSGIGIVSANERPLNGDKEVTLEDAKKNATLWAAAPDLFETLLEVNNRYASLMTEKMRDKIQSALNKAKGL